MHVVFNLQGSGLGNNGGSRTLIRCAESMALLGADVTMCGANRYTWHKPKGIRFARRNLPQGADAVIATGLYSVPSTCRVKVKAKAYFIRGLERWLATEEKLLASYQKLPCIVNSEWLHEHLRKRGVDSMIVYPGLDLDWFFDRDGSRRGIGALFHNRHKTKRHEDAVGVAKLAGSDLVLLNKHIVGPSPAKLNNWYNGLKVWFAPTELEGLHNPPMEAALAGCALVCTDHPRSGMSDYAINGETALVYPARDLVAAAACVRRLLDDETERRRLNHNMVELLLEKVGDRQRNMRVFLEILGGNL